MTQNIIKDSPSSEITILYVHVSLFNILRIRMSLAELLFCGSQFISQCALAHPGQDG